MKILAIDPGDTSGIISFCTEKGILLRINLEFAELMIFLSLDRTFEKIVCEDFLLYPWMAKEQAFSTFQAVQIIGILKFIDHCRGLGGVTLQPASARNMVTEVMMQKTLGDFFPADFDRWNKHQKDAMKHLVIFLAKLRSEK